MALEDFYPTEQELEKINNNLKVPDRVKTDSGISLRIQAADSDIDRGRDQFQPKALDSMASLAIENRIPLFLAGPASEEDHHWLGVNTKAHIYDAYVENGKLIYKAYFPITTSNRSVIEDVLAGLYDKVSVGFSMSPAEYYCSECNCPIASNQCPHDINDDIYFKIMDVVDNFEVSLVGVPMQSKARVLGKGVDMSDEIKKLAEQVKSLEGLTDDLKVKMFDAIGYKEEAAPAVQELPIPSTHTIQLNLELNQKSQELLDSLTQFKENLTGDKITSDTIQDNTMSEEKKEVIEPAVPAEEVAVETKEAPDGGPDEDAMIPGVLSAMKDTLAGLHEKMDAMHSKIDTMCTKMEYHLGTGQKAVESAVEEVAAEATPAEKSVVKEDKVERSTKSLEERLELPSKEIVSRKSSDEKLWERLNMAGGQ